MKKYLASAVLALVLVAPLAALAVDVPASAESGRLQERFAKQKIEPKVDKKELFKEEQADLPLAKASAIKFKLDSVEIIGNTVLKDEDFVDIYQNKVGSEVSVADLYAIRDEITKRYRQKGYIISRAVIPAQDFSKKGAKVKIQIIEGYINNVTRQGDAGGSESVIDYYISQIKQGGPLNSANLEKYLLLMNDLPGVNAAATLQPAKTGAGGADILINLNNTKVKGLVSIDNSGTKYVGRHLISGEVDVNSPLGIFDQLTLRGITSANTNELKFGGVSYKAPIGTEGTTLKLEYSKTGSNPSSTLKDLVIEGDTSSYKVEIAHPIIRSRSENLSVRSNFEVKNNNTKSVGAELYEDKTRVISLGGTYDLADSLGGVNVVDLSVSQGISAFGSNGANNSSAHSRANGSDVFTKFNMEASRLQQIGSGFALLFATQGQYSLDPLYASEEFGIGGSEFLRGYDFSEITGEQGVVTKIELQYGEHVGYSWLSDYQLYSFYDNGTVWQKDTIVGSEVARESISSVGIGTRLNIITNLSGYVEIAKPLNRDISSENDKKAQLNMGVTYLF